jgi:2-C-methyl-D-erythritol 4-phosphate cytidylyltransferase/2-C-methyl-D-erythritol 2,4-cyclodiphosphate synthase
MKDKHKITAIICAAGKGERAGFDKNKLLAPLYGAPAIYHTLTKFLCEQIDEIILVVSKNDLEVMTALASPFNAKVVLGGETRTDSVYNALKEVTGDIVLIHDGARPFVTQKIIDDCICCVEEHNSAICALPVTDTIAVCDCEEIADVPQRATLYSIQTPQGFFTKDIKAAYQKAIKSGQTYTDDSSVYSQFISPAHIFLGDICNKKLTFKSDFNCEYPPINAQKGQAIGVGIDVHSFGKEQNFVTLCGVKVPSDSGLIAHSDGDVAIHAVMDALLSAAGLKDIGHYFPDTDPKYSGADSIELLKEVVKLTNDKGYAPLNLSLSIQAEKPRLAKYIDEMKANLAAACNLPQNQVAISAGTCEHLGFVGSGYGITATAIVLCDKK